MKLLKIATIVICIAFFCTASIAGEANPVKMAHEVGFVGCDSLINDIFEFALKAPERRFNISYFDGIAKNNVDLTVTFGSTGDTVLQSVHFKKTGGYCYSTEQDIIFKVANCAGLLNNDEYFKYEDDSAGALWAKNKGGINKLFIQSGNSCTQVYLTSKKQKATK